MIRALKTLLLLLLMTALPIQGFAAVMKSSCGPGHHKPVAMTTMVVGDHHAHRAVRGHQHDDGGTAAHAATDHSSHDSSVTANKSSGGYESAYCSACAACYVGAVAPPSAIIQPPVPGGSQLIVVSPAPLVTGYIPGGLKRPPRHISA